MLLWRILIRHGTAVRAILRRFADSANTRSDSEARRVRSIRAFFRFRPRTLSRLTFNEDLRMKSSVRLFTITLAALLASGAAACNTDDANKITSAGNSLDTFNGSGDNVASPIPEGSATPGAAQAFADIAFWDSV